MRGRVDSIGACNWGAIVPEVNMSCVIGGRLLSFIYGVFLAKKMPFFLHFWLFLVVFGHNLAKNELFFFEVFFSVSR
jgi:hypothetical protein